jgi:glycosyltransferase involved in cell wall biosynthesis
VQIAVVVPAFNVAPYLRRALDSMLRQTHTDWSLVVIDDGSTDATAAVAAAFTDPRIRLIRQGNAGVSAARNRGVAAFLDGRIGFPGADSTYCDDTRLPRAQTADAFLFLDGDDFLAPDALVCLAETLEGAPWAVAACGRYARVAADGATYRPGSRVAAPPPKGCLLEALLTRNRFANGGHLLIRREAIEVAGLFRQNLSYGEDWEYWTRVALLGEFVAVHSRMPLLFVCERAGGASLSNGSDPTAYRAAMEAIYANPAIANRLGTLRVAHLWHAAEAEMAWSVGRELIRHGHRWAGQRWLGRSVCNAPSVRRFVLIGVSWLRSGPFQPYLTAR